MKTLLPTLLATMGLLIGAAQSQPHAGESVSAAGSTFASVSAVQGKLPEQRVLGRTSIESAQSSTDSVELGGGNPNGAYVLRGYLTFSPREMIRLRNEGPDAIDISYPTLGISTPLAAGASVLIFPPPGIVFSVSVEVSAGSASTVRWRHFNKKGS